MKTNSRARIPPTDAETLSERSLNNVLEDFSLVLALFIYPPQAN